MWEQKGRVRTMMSFTWWGNKDGDGPYHGDKFTDHDREDGASDRRSTCDDGVRESTLLVDWGEQKTREKVSITDLERPELAREVEDSHQWETIANVGPNMTPALIPCSSPWHSTNSDRERMMRVLIS